MNPVKGLINFCSEKEMCLNEFPLTRMEKKVSYSKMFGEILSEFVQGAGLLGLLAGVALIFVCVRQGGKEKETLVLEFYDDN